MVIFNKKHLIILNVTLYCILVLGCVSKDNDVSHQIDKQESYILRDSLSIDTCLDNGYYLKKELIPSPEIAVQVAEIILKETYGIQNIEKQKPFYVTLINGIWYIEGQLKNDSKGGVAHIEIKKNNGEVLKVYHSK